MNPMNIKIVIEIAVMSLLAVSLLTILYLVISKNSSITMLKSQMKSFTNKTELEIELEKKMSFFHSLVSNAVYIGLFGTTMGVMVTLLNITGDNQKELISSLSLPLLSTAVSIVVAIIGTFCFNFVNAKNEETLKYWDIYHGHSKKSS
jgi:biopolymer transport protein ExbB/TolQ